MNTTTCPLRKSTTVAYLCSAAGCSEIATILVVPESRAESPLCGEHWQATRRLADGPFSAVHVLPRPECFVAACQTPAVEIVVHLDGTHLPCCDTHLEDLSWVTPEATGWEHNYV
jgi:hypothetical protein